MLLDPVPPVVSHDSNGVSDLATVSTDGPLEGLGTEDNMSSIAVWERGGVPTRQQCADLLQAAGPHSIRLPDAPPGTEACVHTLQGRTAYLKITAIGTSQLTDDHCTISVIVWEN